MKAPWVGVVTMAMAAGCGAGGGGGHGANHEARHVHHAAHHGEAHGGMPHRFERAEEWAQTFDDPTRDAWQRPDDVLRALELAPSMRVADVGAGTGYFAVRLARVLTEGEVVATDIEPDMVRYLAERATREQLANIRAVLATSEHAGLDARSVDRVLVVDVWHHLADRAAYARGLAAALRPGGRVLVVDFKLDASQGPPPEHRLAPEAIVDDLVEAGLSARVVPSDLPEQYLVEGRLAD